MSLTFQRETFSAVTPELPPLFARHFAEIAMDQARIPLAPDWDKYRLLESAGTLLILTARDSGALVGYYFAVCSSGLHNRRSQFAETDMFYLSPEYRDGRNGYNLLKKAEAMLWDHGADKITIQTKLAHDVGILFKRLGFRPTEMVYTKVRH